MVRVIGEDKLAELKDEAFVMRGSKSGKPCKSGQEHDVHGDPVVCVTCGVPLRAPIWGEITTKDLDVLELDSTVYNIEIVQKCPNGHLNRMIYADNLSDETLMMTEKTE